MPRFHLISAVILAMSMLTVPAMAQSSDEQWAKKGRAHVAAKRYQQAIKAFKRAYAISPKAKYRCNIGVAAYQHKKWIRAHFALADCLASAPVLPAAGVAAVRKAFVYVEGVLKKGPYAPIRVRLTPSDSVASASFLALDETFKGGRVVWAPIGRQVVRATAKGYRDAEVTVNVAKDVLAEARLVLTRTPTRAVASSANDPARGAHTGAASTPTGPSTSTATSERPPHTRRRTAWLAFGAGAAALAGGIVFHVRALKTVDEVAAEKDRVVYDEKSAQLRREQYWVGGLYTAAALSAGIGTYLWLRGSRRRGARIGTSLGPSHAAVWATWRM